MLDLPLFAWFVAAGLVGSLSRIALQVFRDESYKGSRSKAVSLVFLGAVGGWIAYLIDPSYLGSFSLGFTIPDVIENLASKYTPE